jgi:Zn-dependent protease
MESSTPPIPAPPLATEPERPTVPPPRLPDPHGPDPRDFGLPSDQPKHSNFRQKLGAIGAALVALLAKLKAVLLLLPKVKLLATSGSMLVSIAAYSLLFGWTFAIGFVILILIHEMGHVIALRREGIKASAPMFIPFLGAMISARSLGDNALAEARVGLAGPILGSLGAVASLEIWHATGNPYWRALAYVGFFLNLFNLIPVSPFDGGRAMAAMAPWMWGVGYAVMIVFAILYPNPFIIVFLVIGGFDSWRRWKQIKAGGAKTQAYYRVSPSHRLAVAAVYISLAALLIAGLHATYVYRAL